MTLNRVTRDERAWLYVSAAERMRFEEFVADLSALGRRPKTTDSYRSDWLGLAAWWKAQRGEPFDAASLDGGLARQYKAHVVDARMSPATINRKLVFIKRYGDWLRAEGVIDDAARRGLRSVRPVDQNPRRPQPLSDIEIRRFLRVIDSRAGRRDQAIVYLFLHTGLRVSELVALRREEVQLGARSGVIQVDYPASDRRKARRVPLGAEARRRLRAYLEERGDHAGHLFEGERGPLTANGVQRMMRKFCGFAEVRVSPQKLRHTFAAGYLHEHEDDLVGLAEVLGHETLDTTRLYLDNERRSTMGREPAAAG
jgi:integrase